MAPLPSSTLPRIKQNLSIGTKGEPPPPRRFPTYSSVYIYIYICTYIYSPSPGGESRVGSAAGRGVGGWVASVERGVGDPNMGTKPQHHHRIQLPFPSRTLLSHLTHSLTHSLPTSTSNLTSALSLWIPSSAVRRRSRSRNRGGGRGRGGGGRFSGSAAMAVGVLALQGSFNEHIAWEFFVSVLFDF